MIIGAKDRHGGHKYGKWKEAGYTIQQYGKVGLSK